MRFFSTYLTESDVRLIVATSGRQIRAFFAFLKSPNQSSPFRAMKAGVNPLFKIDSEMRGLISEFQKNPKVFTDKALVERGKDIVKAYRYPVRIEVRRNKGIKGAAQIAVRGIAGDFRKVTLNTFKKLPPFKSKRLVIKQGGFKSYEINVAGVTKALPIRYLKLNWEIILNTMGYKPGTLIDARQTRTLIAADGDGTLFGKPTVTGVPQLSESAAREPLLDYLKAGGVFILISGNSLERTIKRVTNGIPREYKNRFLISANGGADLVIFDRTGKARIVSDYHDHALKAMVKKPKENLDIVYLGDDAAPHGNDADGFKEVGRKHSVLVGDRHHQTKHLFLEDRMIAGAEKATAAFLRAVYKELQNNPSGVLFSEKRLSTICRFCR